MVKIKEKIEKITKKPFKISKIIVFVCLFLTAGVMYYIGNSFVGGAILVILSLFLIFGKIESMERRIVELEKRR